jgi:transposase-like protein
MAKGEESEGSVGWVLEQLDFKGLTQDDVLGLWIAESEGEVLDEGAERADLLRMEDSSLPIWTTGFSNVFRFVFPDTRVQLCIVHMVCNSTKYVSYKRHFYI